MYPSDMTDEQCEIVQKHFPVGKRAGRSRVRSAQDTLLGSFSQVFGQHMSLCVGHTAWVYGDFAIHLGFEDRLF